MNTFQPYGTQMLCRPFKIERQTNTIEEIDEKIPTIAPLLEIVALGNNCTNAKVGQFAFYTMRQDPVPIVLNGERFLLIQEGACYGFYSEKPPYEEMIQLPSAVTKDITDYVKVDVTSQMKLDLGR